MIISRFIHVAANGIIVFILWLSTISLCLCTISSLFTHLLRDILFHVLVIVNSVAVNIGAHVSLQIIVLFGFLPRSGTAESYGNSIFSLFEELPYCFPEWLCQFTCRSLFSTSSPAFVICRHFNNSYSDWCKLVSPHSFDLHVSNN